jgi:hypothetical protein
MTLACAYCGQLNYISDHLVGGEVHCRNCGQSLIVTPNKPPEAERQPIAVHVPTAVQARSLGMSALN